MEAKRNNSIKRTAILNALHLTREHPSAEMLYETLKPDYPDLSLGTVYRNLGVLCDEGLVRSVGKLNGKERFDGRTEAHAHFLCTNCSRVLDVDMDVLPEDIFADIDNTLGVNVKGCDVTFNGICGRCR